MLAISLADDLSSQSSCELQCESGKKYTVSEHSISTETLQKCLISMVSLNKQQLAFTSHNNGVMPFCLIVFNSVKGLRFQRTNSVKDLMS